MARNTDIESENPRVVLLPNSLYIATETIMSPGFHWSLFITDDNGVANQHQWAEPHPGLPSHDNAESYIYDIVDPPRTFTHNRFMLCYLRVDGYKGQTAVETDFVGMFSGIFTESYKTVMENRKANLTCRTWLLKALVNMIDAGLLTRENGIEGIEDTVKTMSTASELATTNGMVMPVVETI